MKKIIFVSLGLVFTAIGCIGIILPVLPTTPFLLLASACFAKGSDRFNRWFLSTKLYQNHLEGFIKKRSMTLKAKIILLLFASSMLAIAFILMDNLLGRLFILGLVFFKYYYFIFRIRTIPESVPVRSA